MKNLNFIVSMAASFAILVAANTAFADFGSCKKLFDSREVYSRSAKQEMKFRLQSLGFAEVVANRIVTHAPDLAQQILQSPNQEIADFRIPDTEGRLPEQPTNFAMPSYPVGYRGLQVEAENYNPKFISRLYGDKTWFGDLAQAILYARSTSAPQNSTQQTGILLELQIPRMFMYDPKTLSISSESTAGAFSISKIVDESLFVTRVGIVNGAVGSNGPHQPNSRIVEWLDINDFNKLSNLEKNEAALSNLVASLAKSQDATLINRESSRRSKIVAFNSENFISREEYYAAIVNDRLYIASNYFRYAGKREGFKQFIGSVKRIEKKRLAQSTTRQAEFAIDAIGEIQLNIDGSIVVSGFNGKTTSEAHALKLAERFKRISSSSDVSWMDRLSSGAQPRTFNP